MANEKTKPAPFVRTLRRVETAALWAIMICILMLDSSGRLGQRRIKVSQLYPPLAPRARPRGARGIGDAFMAFPPQESNAERLAEQLVAHYRSHYHPDAGRKIQAALELA